MARALTVISATLAAAAVGYVVYFDYSRRNSAEFRRKLRAQRKSHEDKLKQAQEFEKKAKLDQVREFLTINLAAEPVVTDPAQRENYFLSNVAEGEKLAVVPGMELEAALKFYRALSVYPSPTDILGIYQRSIPEAIYEYIVLMIAIQPPSSISSLLGAEAPSSASAASAAALD